MQLVAAAVVIVRHHVRGDRRATVGATSVRLKLLHVDEYTREALAMRVARSIDADHTTRVLDQIARERGAGPDLVRMDNGPEMTANALRDWCRFSGPSADSSSRASRGTNPFVESFGSRVRDEVPRAAAADEICRLVAS